MASSKKRVELIRQAFDEFGIFYGAAVFLLDVVAQVVEARRVVVVVSDMFVSALAALGRTPIIHWKLWAP